MSVSTIPSASVFPDLTGAMARRYCHWQASLYGSDSCL
ncbi:hypothetical protein FOPG_19653 [Fusarium oxysporum f. sp. conglutinans race 2 54008]|uniref:Uncharacterized protein n=1 Tax=Fusarium oxysporum f. sp. conglutinans race 2 54008 TaxID=1089457 RepID=X0GKA4_FUSOX|nr:hypothetical protein FOPG_19653 [Fusarium oxysporum f. sp. conglutinans race 2 54008]